MGLRDLFKKGRNVAIEAARMGVHSVSSGGTRLVEAARDSAKYAVGTATATGAGIANLTEHVSRAVGGATQSVANAAIDASHLASRSAGIAAHGAQVAGHGLGEAATSIRQGLQVAGRGVRATAQDTAYAVRNAGGREARENVWRPALTSLEAYAPGRRGREARLEVAATYDRLFDKAEAIKDPRRRRDTLIAANIAAAFGPPSRKREVVGDVLTVVPGLEAVGVAWQLGVVADDLTGNPSERLARDVRSSARGTRRQLNAGSLQGRSGETVRFGDLLGFKPRRRGPLGRTGERLFGGA